MLKRIIEHKMISPMLYVPIYPWLNLVDFTLPSGKSNEKHEWKEIGDVFSTLTYVGMKQDKINKKMVMEIFESKHVLLIDDTNQRLKYMNFLDYNLVPSQYRTGNGDDYQKFISDHEKMIKNLTSPQTKLHDDSELMKNKEFAVAALKCFDNEASPSFLDDSILKHFCETYMIICELDELKDENLIFSERLKQNGIKCKVSYSTPGYHGIISDTYKNDEALRLFNDMIKFS